MSSYLSLVLPLMLGVAAGFLQLPESRRQIRWYEMDEPEHEFSRAEACDRMVSKELNDVMVASKCSMPIETMVELVQRNAEYVYVPSKVRVKRCQGMCYTQKTCVPYKNGRQTVKKAVRLQNKLTGEISCGWVSVEEHVRCACNCSLMAHHCNKLQTYHKDECRCKCMDPSVMPKCLAAGKLWNEKRCSCECPHMMECTTGEYWHPHRCECVPLEPFDNGIGSE